MKTKIFLTLALTSTLVGAQGTANDMPKPIWICQEQNRTDGYRELVISVDQFRQLSAQLKVQDFGGEKLLSEYPQVTFEDQSANVHPPLKRSVYRGTRGSGRYNVFIADLSLLAGKSYGTVELYGDYALVGSFEVKCFEPKNR